MVAPEPACRHMQCIEDQVHERHCLIIPFAHHHGTGKHVLPQNLTNHTASVCSNKIVHHPLAHPPASAVGALLVCRCVSMGSSTASSMARLKLLALGSSSAALGAACSLAAAASGSATWPGAAAAAVVPVCIAPDWTVGVALSDSAGGGEFVMRCGSQG